VPVTVRPQDLGGRRGFGAVAIEVDEPVYHEAWEGSVIAGILATIMAGLYNVDQFRAAIDDLEPLSYISIGYYRRWLHTLEVNCVNAGVFSPEELEARIAEIAERPDAPLPPGDDPRLALALRELIENGASNARTLSRPPRFRAGDRVRGRLFPDARHVRIPGYAQGKVGIVQVVHDAFVFPDTNLRNEGENPEHVYAVGFRARELWPDADEGATVLVDLWESYLHPAHEEAT
jgi:nitrile hydratase beta subunit